MACEPGDLFLLCTDGLIDGLYDSHILEILQTAQTLRTRFNPAQRLVRTSVTQSGRDNTTALVIEAR